MSRIVIFDLGSQYTQLIARRIREMNIYAQIVPFNAKIEKDNLDGIILSGSSYSIYDKGAPKCSSKIFRYDIPILGICYGMDVISEYYNGHVSRANKREYGPAKLIIDDNSNLLFDRSMNGSVVWMSHGDKIDELPKDFYVIAHTQNSEFAAIKHRTKEIYAIQFHPEVSHTSNGYRILENFSKRICKAKSDWNMGNFLEDAIVNIKRTVKNKKVLCALSGGVDSTVVAVLMHKAIGNKLIPIFVNNGLLRKNEEDYVLDAFKSINIDVKYADASELFLGRLNNIVDPEEKRKIIGHTFIDVFVDFANKLKDIEFLAQGTLYPDVIESVSVKGPSDMIKTHHNVGGLPEKLPFKLIEPLRELFKDEVRRLGEKLHINKSFLNRHPFPGPGLAIRIIGTVNEYKLRILRNADEILTDEIKKAGLYNDLWQAFCVLLPVYSVGVMGDRRTYENVVVIRAIESQDGMTAKWARIDYGVLETISSRIINEVEGINRVVFDISSKPPSTIEWE